MQGLAVAQRRGVDIEIRKGSGLVLDTSYLFYTFTGASGAGKDSIAAKVQDLFPSLGRLPSVTTRKPRTDAEERGETNYIFVSDHEFDQMIAQEKLLWTTEPFKDGKRYGTRTEDVAKVKMSRQPVLTDIDPPSLSKLRRFAGLPWVRSFFVTLGNNEQLLETRLRGRGDKVSGEELSKRIRENRWYEDWALMQRQEGVGLIRIDNSGQLETTLENVVRHMRG